LEINNKLQKLKANRNSKKSKPKFANNSAKQIKLPIMKLALT